VLKNKVREQQPRVGDRVGVKYIGEKEGSRGMYGDYRFVVDRPPGAPSAEPQPEPDEPEPQANVLDRVRAHLGVDQPATTETLEQF
jgi:hypothetical protein